MSKLKARSVTSGSFEELDELKFPELTLGMQNSECRMQNEGISFGNEFNLSAKPTQSFCIQHFAFCIWQHKLPDKLKFTIDDTKKPDLQVGFL